MEIEYIEKKIVYKPFSFPHNSAPLTQSAVLSSGAYNFIYFIVRSISYFPFLVKRIDSNVQFIKHYKQCIVLQEKNQ